MMCDALMSPVREDDQIYENRAYSGSSRRFQFPEEHDIRYRSPLRARDQGSRGTCAAFVGATISEGHNFPLETYMSPEFIYHHRETKPNKGMCGRDVFRILKEIGCVPEELYKYNDSEIDIPPDDELYKIASAYRISNFARVDTIVGLKLALLDNEHVYLLLPSYNKSELFWISPIYTNTIPIYHAVTVVGYNREGFIFKNSWGCDWGKNGYGLFPYNYWYVHIECWVSLNSEMNEAHRRRESAALAKGKKRRLFTKTFRRTM